MHECNSHVRSSTRTTVWGQKRARTGQSRRGVAAAELAVCLPMLFVVIFGSIEACNLLFLRQSLVAAAYEGAMLGSRPGTSETDIVNRVQTTLAARNISVTSVDVNVVGAADYAALGQGEIFTVHIEAPALGNNLGIDLFAASNSFGVDVAGHKQ